MFIFIPNVFVSGARMPAVQEKSREDDEPENVNKGMFKYYVEIIKKT